MHIKHRTFAFIWNKCNLHIKTKIQSWTTPSLWNMENKSRQNVCLASCITTVNVHHISHSTGILQVYDHNQKYVASFRVFWWQNNLHEKISFRFCKGSVYSLIFWFFAQVQKDLNEKRSRKYSTVPFRNKRPKIYAKYAYAYAYIRVCVYTRMRMRICAYTLCAYAH